VTLGPLLRSLPLDEQRCLLARRGRLRPGCDAGVVADALERWASEAPSALLALLAEEPGLLALSHRALGHGPWPGRAEALLDVARACGLPLPAGEYEAPEDRLENLLSRAQALVGSRLSPAGAPGHKGRVGDEVERLLLGRKIPGRREDHPAAEVKSVPVLGDRVLERVKLGVVSERSNPLDKCGRVLFIFVEERGQDPFVRGTALAEFDAVRWQGLWRDGWLVETAAGHSGEGRRGLYLVPRWFRHAGLWPQPPRLGRSEGAER
jgi:hypothetical protein